MTVQTWYEVDATNPADPAKHFNTDARGNVYRAPQPEDRGRGYSVTTRQTGSTTTLDEAQGNIPELHLYMAEPDATLKGEYQDLDRVDTAYEARGGPKDARVVETNVYRPQDIETVRTAKLSDLNSHADKVYYSACNLSAVSAWALVLDETTRRRTASITGYFNDREGDRTEDIRSICATATDFANMQALLATVGAGGVRTRWPNSRELHFTIRNKTDGREQRNNVSNIGEYGGIMKDWGEFDVATDGAYVACEAAILAETDQATLEALDVTSQAQWGWPDYWPAVPGAAGVQSTPKR